MPPLKIDILFDIFLLSFFGFSFFFVLTFILILYFLFLNVSVILHFRNTKLLYLFTRVIF